jgi:V8-like Glu-specific endopeptidase
MGPPVQPKTALGHIQNEVTRKVLQKHLFFATSPGRVDGLADEAPQRPQGEEDAVQRVQHSTSGNR